MKFELFPPRVVEEMSRPPTQISYAPLSDSSQIDVRYRSGNTASKQESNLLKLPTDKNENISIDQNSDGSDRSGTAGMPIDKLKVHGNQLNQQNQTQKMGVLTPPASPHPATNSATVQDIATDPSLSSISAAPTLAGPDTTPTSSKPPASMIRRYEFIRRSLTRGEKSTSPTFVIEGRKVIHKNQNGQGDVFPLPPESLSSIEDAKYDFDALAFLESRGALKSTKPVVPPRPKPDAQSGKAAGPCVVLPVLHIEGPGFSHQQLRSKSSSLPPDEQNGEMEEIGTTETTQHPTESIWSELENLDQRYHRAIKKNNFFPPGARIGEDHSELCVENSHKPSNKTITLQLHTSQERQKPVNMHQGLSMKPKTSKSPREKLYRSATNLHGSRPLFQSVNSYLNFNNLNKTRAGLYSSEQYLDSNRLDSILQPIENLKRPVTRKLVAKYSDMEIQKELNDFFKIRPVK